jgi:hypothetical protein
MVLPGPHRWAIKAAPSGGYPAAMFGEFNPAYELPLTVATQTMIVQGSMTTRVRRLTDILNEPDLTQLVLQDARFLEFGSRAVFAEGAAAHIPIGEILFVHSSSPTEGNAAMKMPKKPVEATLLLPPFTIEGTIYLAYESELRIALSAHMDRFIAVTDARYSAYGSAASSVELLAVQHAKANIVIAAGVEWSGEAIAAAEGDAGSNPW